MKPSTQRRRDADALIHTMIAKEQVEYTEELNPFLIGTVRHTRFARLYPRHLATWIEDWPT